MKAFEGLPGVHGAGQGELTGGNAGLITDDSCLCHSVQISYGVRLGKSTFYLEKKSRLKKVS